MQFSVFTYGIPQTIVLSFIADGNVTIRGFDPQYANTEYFNQEVDAATIKALNGKIEINCPWVPEKYMLVEIKGDVKLREIGAKVLPARPLYLASEDEQFLTCAEWFAENAGHLQPGNYQRDNIIFEYYPVIIDEVDGPLTTPARIDHDSGIPQIAKSFFDHYTIAIRYFILCHEWIHFRFDTVDEQQADENALNICLSRGCPKIELVYAATKIFSDDQASRARAAAMIKFINNW